MDVPRLTHANVFGPLVSSHAFSVAPSCTRPRTCVPLGYITLIQESTHQRLFTAAAAGCTGWPQQESPAWFLKKLYQNVPIKLWLDLSVIQAHNFKLLLTRNTFCRTRSLSNATFSFFVHVAFIQFKICSCVQNLVWW